MIVKSLFTYTLKSSRGTSMASVPIERTGFRHDRSVVVVDNQGNIATARERPALVKLESSISGNRLWLEGTTVDTASFELPGPAKGTSIKLFRNRVEGIPFEKRADDWISQYLDGEFRLFYIGDLFNGVLPKRGGKDAEVKTFTDSSPIHLINSRTFEYLSSRTPASIGSRNFRPNIVIDGNEPFEEELWGTVNIGQCSFRMQEKTNRCIFTTIDPDTSDKNKDMEPLATLARTRSVMGERPIFGIGLVPLALGEIKVGDAVKVVQERN